MGVALRPWRHSNIVLHAVGDGGVSQGYAAPTCFSGRACVPARNSGVNMPSLSFAAPTSVDEAVKILAGASGMAKVLAGGTDLLVQLRSGRLKPELIVDTKRIPGMLGIREEANQFVIGAATPGTMIYESEALT